MMLLMVSQSHVFVALLLLSLFGVGANTNAYPKETAEWIYFGNGCFWARQHLFVQELERSMLERSDSHITALTGYAGSTHMGEGDTLCYHNPENFSDYGKLGHAEVVQLNLPYSALTNAFSVYFKSFIELSPGMWARSDYFDQGPEYRSLIGIPGGINNTLMYSLIKRANLHNMSLVPGHGSDPDTFENNTVYVMDSNMYRFKQAERCLQFHDDQLVKYPASYHALRDIGEKSGRIHSTKCPANFVCNSTQLFMV